MRGANSVVYIYARPILGFCKKKVNLQYARVIFDKR